MAKSKKSKSNQKLNLSNLGALIPQGGEPPNGGVESDELPSTDREGTDREGAATPEPPALREFSVKYSGDFQYLESRIDFGDWSYTKVDNDGGVSHHHVTKKTIYGRWQSSQDAYWEKTAALLTSLGGPFGFSVKFHGTYTGVVVELESESKIFHPFNEEEWNLFWEEIAKLMSPLWEIVEEDSEGNKEWGIVPRFSGWMEWNVCKWYAAKVILQNQVFPRIIEGCEKWDWEELWQWFNEYYCQ